VSEFTVIRCGRVIDAVKRSAEPADILIERDTIRTIGKPGLEAPRDAREINATGRLLMPGLVNAHTHSHANLPRGLGDRMTLELALNTNPALRKHFTLEDKYLGAQIGAVEMLSKGCTACYDLVYEFPGPSVEGLLAVAQAYHDVGMRAVVAAMTTDRGFYEAVPGLMEALPEAVRREVQDAPRKSWQEVLKVVSDALREWPFDRGEIRLAIAPTIPAHCSEEFLVGAAKLARQHGVGLHTHLAESKVQAVAGLERYARTLTAHLQALGVLGANFTAAHGVWLDDEDMQRLADAGSAIAHNPASNMRYGSGMARVRRMLELGLRVGIGTDSRSCSDNLNMFEAMRLAAYTSRVQGPDYRRWLSSDEVYELATIASAGVLGMDDSIGRLAPGFKADIVFLDTSHPNYVPLTSVIDQVAYAEDGTAVAAVMVGGRMVVERGRMQTIDYDALAGKVEQAAARLHSKASEDLTRMRALEDVVGSFCVGIAERPYHVHRYCGLP
jgi:guanine deaminase